ncbi:hypothetical protein [Achromobacter insolitus]|uniref:hypothetical protein n=1 Tax=Achromobacter insolitus TaxID=217204 RepID=UPI000537B079|nr:hypothetical protein [Achromobacter insolitus]AVG38516.1 hypothetical protein MC81_03585 [Achromobacter insolitus]
MTFSELLKDYAAPVAWLLVAGGWIINNRQANVRERRKEIRSDIGDLSTDIKSTLALLEKHREAMSDAGYTGITAVSVLASLREIDLRFDRLMNRPYRDRCSMIKSMCQSKREAFYDLASGDEAMSLQLHASVKAEEVRLRLHTAAHTFIDSLHQLFLAEFDR